VGFWFRSDTFFLREILVKGLFTNSGPSSLACIIYWFTNFGPSLRITMLIVVIFVGKYRDGG
jgi:hypothetical protein